VNEPAEVGLCSNCRHARTVTSSKGSRFWLCSRSDTDPRYAKYPRLPVLACPGHEIAASDADNARRRHY
jgi:hypothetical protein